MFEIVIKNGLVVDGSGSAGFRADVAIEGGHIAEVGLLAAAETATVIDATGLVVAPGFIDMHSHADFSLPVYPTADSLVHQGITTAVVGQCGYSPVPLLEESRAKLIRQMDASLGQNPRLRLARFPDRPEGRYSGKCRSGRGPPGKT